MDLPTAARSLLERIDETTHRTTPKGAIASLTGTVGAGAVAAALTAMRGSADTLTVAMDDPSEDPRPAAREMALLYRTRHHERTASLSPAEALPALVAAMSEPLADPSLLPAAVRASVAGTFGDTIVTGDGADEIFAGFDRYAHALREGWLRRILPDLPTRTMRANTGYAAGVAALPTGVWQQIMGRARTYRPETLVESIFERAAGDEAAAAHLTDLATWVPERLACGQDVVATATGVDVVNPLLDASLVAWAAALPTAQKVRGGRGKRVLRTAMASRLPDSYIFPARPVAPLPVDRWFAGRQTALPDLLRQSTRWKDAGFFDVDAVERLLSRHQAGKVRVGRALWSIAVFDTFLARHASARVAEAPVSTLTKAVA